MKKIFILAAIVLTATMVFADQMTAGGAITSNPVDWAQTWQWQGTTVSSFQLFIQTPGVDFSAPGIGSFSDASWHGQLVNPQYVNASGNAATGFTYVTNFEPAAAVPFSYDWYGYNSAGIAIDIGNAAWDGRDWTYSSSALGQNTDPTPTPEPGSFILLGTGLFGAGGLVRRRIHPPQI